MNLAISLLVAASMASLAIGWFKFAMDHRNPQALLWAIVSGVLLVAAVILGAN